MGLAKYNQKRSNGKTPEPFGGQSSETVLRFVIQKHAASQLHYDFRLEMKGVLKSWAVPKGPSTDPAVKRLGMMVEDHPYDYRTFEGIIPKGQYGGGTVIVWDEGTYEPAEPVEGGHEKQEKSLLSQLHSGKIKFILHGKKLKGKFALVKVTGRGENGWLLMKLEDKYAKTQDITLKAKSVLSKKTITQVAQTSHHIYGKSTIQPNTTAKNKKPANNMTLKKANNPLNPKRKVRESEPEKKTIKSVGKRSINTKAVGNKLKSYFEKAKKEKFYTTLKPMLAMLVDKAFDEQGWLYEIKWDGYRAVAFMNKRKVELKSRNDKSFNEKFYPVYDALKDWGINAVLDGEVVVVEENGQANFGALQNWRSEADGTLLYYLFDILWYDGYDLKGLPLTERKALLEKLMPKDSLLRFSKGFETSGIDFLKAAKQLGLEGIMAKRKESIYKAGERGADWLKIKANKRQEVVIGGYTKNIDTSKPFSALLVGVFDKGKFVYTGKIGTGFNIQAQKEMIKQFKPLITNKPPFITEPDVNKPSRFRPNPPKAKATWLKPKLICEVSYAEMTKDGVMRHPSFEGMRKDKEAREVILEKEANTASIVKESKKERIPLTPTMPGERKTLLNPTDETQVRKIGGHEIKFTNLSKVFWPKDNITKRDLINYYYQISPYILPYLKNRPQSLNRHPNGINGKSFYQKDVTGKVPTWMDTYLYHSEGENEDKHFLLGNNEATLLYMAGMGCIEMNPWSSTIRKPDYPTWCIIDLDPDKNSFEQVIKAAQVTKQILDEFGIPSFPKTSGSTGLHIYIPLNNKYTYAHSKEFARLIVTLIHQRLPKYTSLERTVAHRKGKMYLDFLQNRPHATIAAPYALRPKPGATVSMPLAWDEVKTGLHMGDFNIFTAMDRIHQFGDLFKPVLGKGINLQHILKMAKEK